MQFLFLVIVMTGLIYAAWRLIRASADRPVTKVVGPDDDPDFLRNLGRGDPDLH